jgi:large conductance mechanosensitive channel
MAKKKEGGFIADFKKFITRGNVVDMAVGVVIGGAFGKIVTGFVNYIINPFIGIFMGEGSLDSLKTVIDKAVLDEAGEVVTPEVAILWGTWIQTIIDFLIVAFCIFVMVRIITKMSNKMHAKALAEQAEADRLAAEKAEAEKKAADEAAAKKAAEDAALRASLINQEKLLGNILDAIKKN